MSAFVVTYDLGGPLENYPGLISRLQSYVNNWHCQESCWIVGPAQSAFDVAETLRQELGGNDQLFVQRITEESAWWGYPDQLRDWILSVR